MHGKQRSSELPKGLNRKKQEKPLSVVRASNHYSALIYSCSR